jgi:hypothetical protein
MVGLILGTVGPVGAAVLLGAGPSTAAAQTRPGLPDSVTVVPGPNYAKGGVYRVFFGDHYRDLWTTPIRVPALDLQSYAGGLRPTQRGGGQQTKSLRFSAGDGREYTFRSLDKDPTAALPAGLRETFADRIFQDQISSGHPAGALVVPPILDAAGVLHATPLLVALPDDPALGEFRAEFAGKLGFLEERPRDADADGVAFAGAREIVGTEKLFDALDDHPEVRVDAREFLMARLTDVFLGDWDRHRDQWRWARLTDTRGDRWVPIPRDRDQALVRFDGFLLTIVRRQVPQLVNFGPEYPSIVGATWNGRDLDRRLLTELERPTWDSVAGVLASRLTNEVIERAVAALPPEYQPIDASRLREALLARRDGIPSMAMKYYRHLAGHVDVYGSDSADLAEARPVDDRTVEVTVRLARSGAEPYYRRRFYRGETKDVRIYLQGGPDSAHISGDRSFPVEVRVIGGGGDDRFANEGNASAKFYDNRGTNRAIRGSINTKNYVAIEDSTNPTALPHRDWGMKSLSYPVASFGPDAGFMIGWGGRFTRWGFRKKPSASLFHYNAVFATGASTGRLSMYGRFQRENSRNYLSFDALASGVEVVRWYGFGNETTIDDARPISFYRATQHQFALAPSIGWALGGATTLELGPRFKYAVTELDDGQNATRFIATDRPFGSGNFTQLGFGGTLLVDGRDHQLAPTRGVVLELGGSAYPRLLDVTRAFGEVHGRLATYLSPRMPGSPTLALQVGGKKLFATADSLPFHEAAFLGSSGTLRGFRSYRFAGDQGAVYGTAELRLHLTSAFIFVPGRQGLIGFTDVGRVYHRGEESDSWHHSYGGGVWLAFLTPGSVLSAVLGHSEEGNKVYVRIGFAF